MKNLLKKKTKIPDNAVHVRVCVCVLCKRETYVSIKNIYGRSAEKSLALFGKNELLVLLLRNSGAGNEYVY